jgi:hypothetical protein
MQNNDSDIQIRYQKAITSTNPTTYTYLTDASSNPETCPPGGTGPLLEQGQRIEVTTIAHFHPVVPMLNLPVYDIQATSRRTILVDIQIK